MTCREAEQLVMPFIRDELSNDQLIAFMEHVDSCECCKEELEIYFMVDVGLRQLDEGSGSYDISRKLERTIEDAMDRIRNIWMLKVFVYSVNTLATMGLLVSILLQCRIWWQNGIF